MLREFGVRLLVEGNNIWFGVVGVTWDLLKVGLRALAALGGRMLETEHFFKYLGSSEAVLLEAFRGSGTVSLETIERSGTDRLVALVRTG